MKKVIHEPMWNSVNFGPHTYQGSWRVRNKCGWALANQTVRVWFMCIRKPNVRKCGPDLQTICEWLKDSSLRTKICLSFVRTLRDVPAQCSRLSQYDSCLWTVHMWFDCATKCWFSICQNCGSSYEPNVYPALEKRWKECISLKGDYVDE